jgi:hypothetical protein
LKDVTKMPKIVILMPTEVAFFKGRPMYRIHEKENFCAGILRRIGLVVLYNEE